MPTGERIHTTPRYIKHPPYPNFPAVDGTALDAGVAHIVHSNLSHLGEQNTRHIGSVRGPGSVVGYGKEPYAYDGLLDAGPTDTTDTTYEYRRIAWKLGLDCLTFGPHMASFVNLQTDPPGYQPRTVGFRVQGYKGPFTGAGRGITPVFAVTVGPAPPSLQVPLAYKVGSTYTSTAIWTWTSTLELGPVRASREMLCRSDATDADTRTRVVDLYYWLGWFCTSKAATVADRDRIWQLDVWELA